MSAVSGKTIMNMKKLILSATTLSFAASMSSAIPQKAAEITVSGYTGSALGTIW